MGFICSICKYSQRGRSTTEERAGERGAGEIREGGR